MGFVEKLAAAQQRNHSWVCVGLDIDARKIPLPLQKMDDPALPFARAIIDATRDVACAFKPNLGFYLAQGAAGVIALERLMRYIPTDLPIILDAKFGDIGSTAEQYARAAFEALGADAVTLSPYVGSDAVKPFLAYADKGVFVLARTSNPGAGEFQNLIVEREEKREERAAKSEERGSLNALRPSLFAAVARKAVEWRRQGPGACGLVVGATYPQELADLRALAPELPFLVPGVGAQGGDLAATVRYGPTQAGLGPVINASRSIVYASSQEDFAQAARAAALKLRDEINMMRDV
jgi:orotidine-5'-phosphate decarboxylase